MYQLIQACIFIAGLAEHISFPAGALCSVPECDRFRFRCGFLVGFSWTGPAVNASGSLPQQTAAAT